MVWKVRADCTYTTSSNKTSRQTAVQNLMPSYSDAIEPEVSARFPAGITSQSSTRFTVSYDFEDGARAIQFKNAVASAMQASARSRTLISVHEG